MFVYAGTTVNNRSLNYRSNKTGNTLIKSTLQSTSCSLSTTANAPDHLHFNHWNPFIYGRYNVQEADELFTITNE